MRFIVAFGGRYTREEHPRLPVAHPDNYLLIEAEDYDAARDVAIALLGSMWSGLYPHERKQDRVENNRFYPEGACARVSTTDPELEVIVRAGWAAQAVTPT